MTAVLASVFADGTIRNLGIRGSLSARPIHLSAPSVPERLLLAKLSLRNKDEAGTRRAAKGTVGLRLRVERFDARAKLSQNKSPEVRSAITDRFAETNTALAEEMRRVHP